MLTRTKLLTESCCSACGDPDSDEPCDSEKKAAAKTSKKARQKPASGVTEGTKGAYPFADKEEQYARYSVAQLQYGLKDAKSAMDAMRGGDLAAENWYADDMHTILKELNKRGVKGPKNAGRSPVGEDLLSEATQPGVLPQDADKLLRKAIPAMLKRVMPGKDWLMGKSAAIPLTMKNAESYLAWLAKASGKNYDVDISLSYDVPEQEWALSVRHSYNSKNYVWLDGKGATVKDAIKNTQDASPEPQEEQEASDLTRTPLKTEAAFWSSGQQMPQGNFDFTSKPWPEKEPVTDKEKLLQKLAYMHKHHPDDGYGKIGDAIKQGNYKAANAAAMIIYKNTHGQINYVPDVNAVFGKA